MTQQLTIKNLSVSYQENKVVNNVSFSLGKGKIGCILGPSGCGKTTILRTIAGFERSDSGTIKILDRTLTSKDEFIAPEQRQIGMVFQDFALFPHLNTEQNICFGIKHLSKNAQKKRLDELLALINLKGSDKKFPHQLSGGQQQRIALARAIAPKPEILLMDEPFSSLDVELRQVLAKQIRNILKLENITAILVTHDQHEAFALSDEICVMNDGIIQQHDTAYNLYHKPHNKFVADFIGSGVFIEGTVIEGHKVETLLGNIKGSKTEEFEIGSQVTVLIRPDDIIHDDLAKDYATVIDKDFRGADFLYTLELPSKVQVLCFAPSHHNHKIGEAIGIRLEADHLVTFKT